ncbi:MAG: DUF1569 domain-containing protein [Candidatus Sumerlaeia bacterium]|nr:DUF1569 domain-containing protein [Candidatus Sumerlaeia bacterium]
MFNRRPLDRQSATVFEERINRLRPDQTPQFGTLTSHRMLTHLEATFRVSLGTAPCEDISNALLRTAPMRWLVINILPLPKGKMKAPESLTPEPVVSFEESRIALLEQLREFMQATEAEPNRRTLDPWLGMITLREWSKIHAMHLDHHLKQFAV